jgi:hypothetical protein
MAWRIRVDDIIDILTNTPDERLCASRSVAIGIGQGAAARRGSCVTEETTLYGVGTMFLILLIDGLLVLPRLLRRVG